MNSKITVRFATACLFMLATQSVPAQAPQLPEPPAAPAQPTQPGMVRLPIGKWLIAFNNDVVEDVEVRSNGTASVTEAKRKSEGIVSYNEGVVTITFDDGRLERWTEDAASPMTKVQHWVSKDQVTGEGIIGRAIQPAGDGKWSFAKESRSIQGLSLIDTPYHPASPGFPQALDITDLYDADSDKVGGHRQKPEVLDIQVWNEERDPWVKLVPGSGKFYIEFSDRTYGPIEGNPFEKLNVLPMLVAQMKSHALAERNRRFTNMLTHRDDAVQSAAYAALLQLEGVEIDAENLLKLIKTEIEARPNSASVAAGREVMRTLENRAKAAGMVVHEWGTFTVLQGSNGADLEWYQPQHDLVGLPKFVQSPVSSVRLGMKSGTGMLALSRNGRYTGMDTHAHGDTCDLFLPKARVRHQGDG